MAVKVTPQMWVRRIVSSVLLVAVLSGLIFGAVKGYQVLHARLSEHQENVAVQAGNLPVNISECRFKDIDAKLEPDPLTPLVGEGFTLQVKFINRGREECSINTGQLEVRLKTGDLVVWTPTACTDSWDRQLLLPADGSWQGALTWDGSIYSECEVSKAAEGGASLIADEGAYLVEGTLLGEKVTPEPRVLVTY